MDSAPEFMTNDWSLVAPGDHVLYENTWYLVLNIRRQFDALYDVDLWSPSSGQRDVVIYESGAPPVRIRSHSDSRPLQEHGVPQEGASERPEPIKKGKWFQVLGFPCVPGDISLAERRYKRLVNVYHPDRGGDHESMARLNDAIKEARRHFSLDTRE